APYTSADNAEVSYQRGLNYTAEAVRAECCTMVRQGTVVAARGFRPGDVPVLTLVDIAEGRSSVLEYGGFTSSDALAVPIEDEIGMHLVLARVDGSFSDDDQQ